MPNFYKTKLDPLSGSSYSEIYKETYRAYKQTFVVRTKRRPYLRSKYFKKEKVFLSIFWGHLKDKQDKEIKTISMRLRVARKNHL